MNQTRYTKLLYVGLLFALVACQAKAPPAPTAVPPVAAPTAAALPTTAVAATASQAPLFSAATFKIPLSLGFGPDWQVRYNSPGKFEIDNTHDFGLAFYVVTSANLTDPLDGHLVPFPTDFPAWIKSDPDFAAVTSTPVTVAGLTGLQIDASPIWKSATLKLKLFLSLSGDITRNLEGQPDGENIVTDPEHWRFILLNNVNSERLLMLLVDGNGHDFQDAVAQTQTVLNTVAFAKSAATAIPASSASATQSIANAPAAPVVATWKITRPEDIVFGFDSVWVPSRRDPNQTTRLDPKSNQIMTVVPGTGHLAKSAVVVGNAVWVAGQSSDLAPIDPQTNKVGPLVPGDHPRIAYGFNAIWAVGHQGEPLDRVDPATSRIMASIPLEGKVADSGEENGVWVTASAVWVIANNELIKVDPTANKVVFRTTMNQVVADAQAQTTVPVGKGTDFLWIPWDAGLIRLDPNTGAGLTLLPNITGALAVSAATVWVGQDTGELIRVSVATNQVEARYKIEPGASTVALGYGSVWLAYSEVGMVQRLNLAP